MFKLRFLPVAVVCFLWLGDLNFFAGVNGGKWLQLSVAEARSSAARGGGGSFSRPSSSRPSSSPSRSSGGSSSNSSPPRDRAGSAAQPSSGNTGGRGRGGSFDNRPTPTPVPYPSGGGGYRPSYPQQEPYPYNPPRYPTGGGTTVIVPVPVPERTYYPAYPAQTPYYPTQPVPVQTPYYPTGGSVAEPVPSPVGYPAGGNYNDRKSGNGLWGFLLFLLVCGGILLIAWMILSKKNQTTSESELENDIVTVSKLQIALLAGARDVQRELSNLTVNADLESSEGLRQFLQESALAVLRCPEYWSHVLSSSQTVNSREEAQQVFEQISIGERSKFSAETLSNVEGYVQRRSGVPVDGDEGPAAYIVVTFLVGTADDKPLFGKIYSAEELRQTLTQLASVSSDYLFVFELLWSPQDEMDTLTTDELLMEYGDMVLI